MSEVQKREVVAVRKDENGNLSEFKLDDGTVYDFKECWDAIGRGELDLVATTGEEGVPILGSPGDGNPENNLSNLPTFQVNYAVVGIGSISVAYPYFCCKHMYFEYPDDFRYTHILLIKCIKGG